jgi:hypothetical protein
LRNIFTHEQQAVLNEIDTQRDTFKQSDYEHNIIIAFWFAIHLEDYELTQQLVMREFILK